MHRRRLAEPATHRWRHGHGRPTTHATRSIIAGATRRSALASLAKRPDGRRRARYRDAADKEHSRHFARELDAQRWLDEVTTSVVTGQYVDPKAGRVTCETFYAEWAARQVWGPPPSSR